MPKSASTKTYSLDTNTCIDLIRNNQTRQVRLHFERAVHRGAVIVISSVVSHELWYGVRNSGEKRHQYALEAFLAGVQVLDFTDDDARMAGKVRAALARSGLSIGPFDTLIAGQALCRKLTVVTSYVREFSRVAGLATTDWRSPP
jgi:tRNA(fMet)-specific endonuclease VapC